MAAWWGTGGLHFSPNADFDRGMLVTTLWRQAGSPGMEDENWGYLYKDMNRDAYYGTDI